MTDTLKPEDLLRYQTANGQAAQAQQRALEAQQALIGAVAVAKHVTGEIVATYGLQPGDQVNPQTGAITRAQAPGSSDVASGVPGQHGLDNPANLKNRRPKLRP